MGIFKKLFGPSKSDKWKQVPNDVEGEFYKGNIFKNPKIITHHKHWTIKLDIYKISHGYYSEGGISSIRKYTRMRANFQNKNNVIFHIYKQGIFQKIGKLLQLNFQDIQAGNQSFDKKHTIKGNDLDRIKDLFADPKLQQLILDSPKINLKTIKRSSIIQLFSKGSHQLYYETKGEINDPQKLTKLFDLFNHALSKLVHVA